MTWRIRLFLIPSALLGLAAQSSQPVQHPPEGGAGLVVQRAIEYAGGARAWASKKSVEFRKTITRFHPDGSVERRRVEMHRYRLQPTLGARVEREEDGKKILMMNDGRQAWKFVDGQPVTTQEDINSARGTTFGSHYVFGMPFKLLDPGVHLSPAGREKLSDGTEVEKIRATYDKGAGDAGGFHTWTYYFDVKTGRLGANNLNYESGKWDFTEYYDDRAFSGVRVATRRWGYNSDARGKTGPMTSEIIYEDVRFDVPVEDSLFSPPKP